jgi:hypothetical protein
MKIVYHIPDEYERFQTRIRRLSLEDIAASIRRNKIREGYGSTENTVSLVIPKS